MTDANKYPTIHSMAYITLPEYCRVGGFDQQVVTDALSDSGSVTWGGDGSTFITARMLAFVCNQRAPMKVPPTIDPDLFVFLG